MRPAAPLRRQLRLEQRRDEEDVVRELHPAQLAIRADRIRGESGFSKARQELGAGLVVAEEALEVLTLAHDGGEARAGQNAKLGLAYELGIGFAALLDCTSHRRDDVDCAGRVVLGRIGIRDAEQVPRGLDERVLKAAT